MSGLLGVLLVLTGVAGAPLVCNVAIDVSAKQDCCAEGMNTWRANMPVFKQMEDAKTAAELDAGNDETGDLSRYAASTQRAYDLSVTKRTYEQGLRDCLNSDAPYFPPQAEEATQRRENVERLLIIKKASAKGATDAASTASVSAVAAASAYAAFHSEAGPTVFDADTHLEAANVAVDNAQSTHDQAVADLNAAKIAFQTASDNAETADAAAATAEHALAELQASHKQQSDEFSTELAGLQSLHTDKEKVQADTDEAHATKQKLFDEADDVDKAGLQADMDDAQTAADDAVAATDAAAADVKAKEDEMEAYDTASYAELESAVTTRDAAVTAAKLTKEAKDSAESDKESAAVALKAAAGALEEAVSVQGATHAILQEAQDSSETGTVDVAVLKQKANTANTVALQAQAAKDDAHQDVLDTHRVLLHAMADEEYSISAKAATERTEAAHEWDKKMAISDQLHGNVENSYARFNECINGDKWVCN